MIAFVIVFGPSLLLSFIEPVIERAGSSSPMKLARPRSHI